VPEVVGGCFEVPPEEVGCEWWRGHGEGGDNYTAICFDGW
jgi:hypothetical protein